MASSTATATAAGRKRKADTPPQPDEQKAPRITAEMEDELQCPICLEVPLGEILQCGNGCTVCQSCQEKTGRDTCGQCRGQMKSREGEWIRSRTLEKMLDKMSIPCRFQDKGCTAVLPRAELRQHLEECDKSGNVIQICSYFPGGRNCNFKINCTKPREAFQHFEASHSTIRCTTGGLRIPAQMIDKHNYSALITADEEKVHCLLVVSADWVDNAIHFLALRLDKTPVTPAKKMRMMIVITSFSDKVADLKLEIPVVAFVDAPATLQQPPLIRLAKSLLQEQYSEKDTGKINITVKIIVD